jgi:hypothetical protein
MAMMLDKQAAAAAAAESEAQQRQFQQSEETSVSSYDEDRQQQQQQQQHTIKKQDASSPFKSPCSVRLAADTSMGVVGGSRGTSGGTKRSNTSRHQPSPAVAASVSSSPVRRIPRRNKSVTIENRQHTTSNININNNNNNNGRTATATTAGAQAAASRRHSMPFVPSASDDYGQNMSDSFAEIHFNPVCDSDCTQQSDHATTKEQQRQLQPPTPQKQKPAPQQQQLQQQQPIMTPGRKIAANLLRRANSSKNWLVPRSPRSKLSAFFSNTNNTTDSDEDDVDNVDNDDNVDNAGDAEIEKDKKVPPIRPRTNYGAHGVVRVPPARSVPVPLTLLPQPTFYASPIDQPRQNSSRNSNISSSRQVQMPVVPSSAPTLRKPSVGVLNRGGQLHRTTAAAGGGVNGGPALDYCCRRTASTMDLMMAYDEILQEFDDSARGGRTTNVSTGLLEEEKSRMSDGGGTAAIDNKNNNKSLLNKKCSLPGPPLLLVQDDEKASTVSDGDDKDNGDDDDDDDDDDDASIGLPEPVTAAAAAAAAGTKTPLALNRGGQVTSPQHAYFGRRAASTKDILDTYKNILDEFDDSLNDSSLNASASSALALGLDDNLILGKESDENVEDDFSTMTPQSRQRRRISRSTININNTKAASAVRLRQSRQRRKSVGVCDADAGKASLAAPPQSPTKQSRELRHSEHIISTSPAARAAKSPRQQEPRQRRNSTSGGGGGGYANTMKLISSYKQILRECDDSICANSRADDSTLWTMGANKSTKSTTISYTHSAPTIRKPQTALSTLLQQPQPQQQESNAKCKDTKNHGTQEKPLFAPPLELQNE